MRDSDVRRELHHLDGGDHAQDTLVIDELAVCQGAQRVDVAVINGELVGYEIKSERDTLERLPAQRDAYAQVFDRLYLVASEVHLETVKSRGMLGEWWGLLRADADKAGTVTLHPEQPARLNPDVDALALAQLLWREEVLAALEERGLATGALRRGSRRLMWRALTDQCELQEIAALVRRAIKARPNWRGRPVGRAQCGETS